MADNHSLPLGVFSPLAGGRPRICTRTADGVVDLAALAALSDSPLTDILSSSTLDALLAAGRPVWSHLRNQLLDWVNSGAHERWLTPAGAVTMHLPFTVADYVDFYASEHHARRVGELFRPGQPPLPKAWLHLPQGYHGRSGTVVVSETPIRRPQGLVWSGDDAVLQPTSRLDVEVEVGFVVGTASTRENPLSCKDFRDHVFGLVVLNDWSARDIQAFETVPLGPFLGKSFATSMSPWVVQLDAIDHLRVAVGSSGTQVASYLTETKPQGYDLELSLAINGETVATQPFSAMHWSPAQMLAHLTINGANVRSGDLFASGTVSGPELSQAGCLLELYAGQRFLGDGDLVSISATAASPHGEATLELGEVTGTIVG